MMHKHGQRTRYVFAVLATREKEREARCTDALPVRQLAAASRSTTHISEINSHVGQKNGPSYHSHLKKLVC